MEDFVGHTLVNSLDKNLSIGQHDYILFRVSEDTACDSKGGSVPLRLDPPSWFAIRVRLRYEKQVVQSIESKGVETFLPLYVSHRRWSNRTKKFKRHSSMGTCFAI